VEHCLKILKNRATGIGLQQFKLIGKTISGSGFKDFIYGGAIY
jgi:hypothetical protein